MVAALKPELSLSSPPLLFEPDPRPEGHRGVWGGWRQRRAREAGQDEYISYRVHADDAWGATVQEIIVRYALHGASRSSLAREYHMSERGIQAYVSGKSWRAYGDPVRAALRRLGLTPSQLGDARRYQGIGEAFCRLAPDIRLLLSRDPRPLAQEIVADLAILTINRPLLREVAG